MITMGISDIVEPLLSSHHKIVGIIECAPRNSTKLFGSVFTIWLNQVTAN